MAIIGHGTSYVNLCEKNLGVNVVPVAPLIRSEIALLAAVRE